jgi:ribonuclease P protein component
MDETDVSAKRTQTRQDARIPQADVDQGGPSGDPVAPRQGTPTPLGVTTGRDPRSLSAPRMESIRSHRTFAALRRTPHRGRSGPIAVSFVEQPCWSRTEIAFAINRRVGNAVVRNRLRRRLRAIMGEHVAGLPTGAYVISTGPEGPGLTFEELKVAMSRATERATGGHRGDPGAPRRQTDAVGR